ncbi:MAG: cadmium-translocating P-type ATPase [Deltaproteobacteria bacterium]|nr:cadmium-translocating P-type ATPase [Deltaproteobacteria bacterium]
MSHGHEHGHDHDDHDTEHRHAHGAASAGGGAIRPRTRPAEDGGPAVQLDVEVLLPGAGTGRAKKLEQILTGRRGIAKAHVAGEGQARELCVHYDPEAVPLASVLALVRSTGAEVSKRYAERTWLVKGMDCAQCGTVIEHSLARTKGVLSARVAYGSGVLVVEVDTRSTSARDIEKRVNALGFELIERGGEDDHGHSHDASPGLEIPLVVASGVALALGYGLSRAGAGPTWAPATLFVIAFATGGLYAFRDALNSVRQLRFDIETLMVVAAVGAAVLGAWLEGALLLFLFALGHALEHRAMARARNAVSALGKLRPETARVRRGDAVVDLPVAEVAVGDVVLVRPGDRVPLDGVIERGQSALDQAAITGESIPVAKGPGDGVFAGTINTDAALEVKVTKLAKESALARVMQMVAEAEAQKSPTQRFTQALERRFVPIVLVAAPALALVRIFVQGTAVKDAVLQAMALLVAASPCALAIATPAAVLSAIARAARSGVLMKGGAHLEALGKVSTIAFDKTGTLTEGKPRLVTVWSAPGATDEELLATTAGAEALSAHPLAKAIVDGALARGVAPLEAASLEAVHGKGLRSAVAGEPVAIGNVAMFDGEEIPDGVRSQMAQMESEGQTTMIVKRGERFLGVIGMADTARGAAKATLASLKALGITRTVMLSGDNLRVAEAVAAQVGITETRAPLLPEGKVDALRELAREGGVAMVGDGVNDAPALAAATVGIAMGGAGSDVALETADVVLMSDDLTKLPFAVGLARRSTLVIRLNLLVAIGISVLLMISAVFQWVGISQAVIVHEGSTLLVVFNGLALLAYPEPRST